jgi:diguanylate cyclase (GGDEF)-like protein
LFVLEAHRDVHERSAFDPVFLRGRGTIAVIVLGFFLIWLTGLINSWTGPELSCSIFYLLPIGLAAWWGGFEAGILLALASTVAWHFAEASNSSHVHAVVRIWNGVIRFGFFVITSSLLSRLRVALSREQALARSDALTGVANGRTFYDLARVELCRFQRTGRPFTVVYLDLDDFKKVNDRLGHPAGDDLLRRVARTLRENTRVLDVAARLGGDEFAILLPETDAEDAARVLDKLRTALLRTGEGGKIAITCSIGAATFRYPPRDVDDMIQSVDTLMYAVKREGKNQVRHCVIENSGRARELVPARRERRACVRHLCTQKVRLSTDAAEGEREHPAVIENISISGVGLRCELDLPMSSLLTLEILDNSRPRLLLARVIRREPQGRGWLYGCELSQRMGEEDLRDWFA